MSQPNLPTWHTFCYSIKTMRGKYAFVEEDGNWSRVRWGSNGDNVHWIVADAPLGQKRLSVIMDKIGLFPANEIITDGKEGYKFGKYFMKWRVIW